MSKLNQDRMEETNENATRRESQNETNTMVETDENERTRESQNETRNISGWQTASRNDNIANPHESHTGKRKRRWDEWVIPGTKQGWTIKTEEEIRLASERPKPWWYGRRDVLINVKRINRNTFLIERAAVKPYARFLEDGVGNHVPRLLFKRMIWSMQEEMMKMHKEQHRIAMRSVFKQIMEGRTIILQCILKPKTPWDSSDDTRFYHVAYRYFEGEIFGRVPGWGKPYVVKLNQYHWGDHNFRFRNKNAKTKLQKGLYFHR